MERDSLHGVDLDQPLSLYNSHIIGKPLLSTTYWSFSPSRGLLKAPPLSLRHSAPYSLQPPLLPLPSSLPRRSSSFPFPPCSPAIKSGTRKPRDHHSFTPKKSTKSSTKNNIPKKTQTHTRSSDTAAISSTSKDNSVIESSRCLKDVKGEIDMLPGSGAAFTISPPPSSLPLPTFYLRPKLSCNAVASGIDAGATDDLRRLLRLQ